MWPGVGTFRFRWQIPLKIFALVLLIVAGNLLASWVADMLRLEIRPSNEELVHRAIMISAVTYAVLIAIPFVPGIEIGLALISMFGPPIVLLVYLSTLVGLSASFAVGRFISLAGLINLLHDLQFHRASDLLRTIEPMNMDDRLAFLLKNAPNRAVPFLLRRRHIALAIAINLPGNFLIGGGGGIALIAGVSRLISIPGYLATIAIAVSPVPIAILMFGSQILPT